MEPITADVGSSGDAGGHSKSPKSPVEKMRVRLAAEGYDSKYVPMDENDSDDERPGSKKKDRKCGNQTVSPCIVLIAVSLIVIAGFTILAILLKIRLDHINKVCQTSDCVVTSGIMLSKMNTAVDPCTDFYLYSCEAFTSDISIPPDKTLYTTLGGDMNTRIQMKLRRLLETDGAVYRGHNSTAIAKAKQFYDTCMNITATEFQGNTPLLQLVNLLGSWTVTSDTWDEKTLSIESAVATSNLYGFFPFFSAAVVTDDKNSSVNIISMDQDGLSLFDYKSYIGNSSEVFRQAFIEYFVSITTLMGGGSSVRSLAEDVWEFEKELAEIFVPPEDREDVNKMYNLRSIDEVQKYFGNTFDFEKYLEEVYGSRLSQSEPILVRVPAYFRKLGKLMRAAKKETLANYVVWQAVSAMIQHLSTSYRLSLLQLKTAIYGISAESQRWEFCVGHANNALGFATGALYIEQYFSENDRLKVEDVLNRVWSEFKDRLADNSWMDESTKKIAVDKVESLLYKIGYPEFISDVDKLDKYYSKLNVTNSSFWNALNTAAFNMRKNRAKLGKVPDKSEWSMTPAQVNAYYDPSINQIVIPAGILQRPTYERTFPESLIYGSVGFIIGHEITHGFDNIGRKYDKYGNMVDWWGNASAQHFESLAQCFVDEYNKFEVYGHHLNGISTKDENIADNGGLRISYQAYQRWLSSHRSDDKLLPGLNMTGEQQFFLSFAQTWCAYYNPAYAVQLLVTDVHSNSKYRVNGVVRNMPEFSKAFDCPKNAVLNPENRCSLW